MDLVTRLIKGKPSVIAYTVVAEVFTTDPRESWPVPWGSVDPCQ